MYQLEETYYFYLLAVIPILWMCYLLLQMWKKKAQKKFASSEVFPLLSPSTSLIKSTAKIFLVSLALALIIIGLVNPKIGTELEEVTREGVDVVFAIDVSKSMLAEDIAPNRLEKSKQLVSQILNSLSGDRVGIVGYAGSAFPQLPITTDYNAARMFLNSMNTNMVSSQGTAIADAISLAQTYYSDEEETNRVLIIISDGEDHQGNLENTIAEAADKGIKIVTISVGTLSGGPIPIKQNGKLESYMRDRNGERVITALDEVSLKNMASQTGGVYIQGNVTSQVIEEVKTYLNTLDKVAFESMQFANFKSYFQWFLAGGILFLFIDLLFLERKTKWLQHLNLFNEKKK